MQQIISTCKALTEPIRLRIIAFRGQGVPCVCALVDFLQMPKPTGSRHLAVLKSSGWVTGRRQVVWIYYRLQDDDRGLVTGRSLSSLSISRAWMMCGRICCVLPAIAVPGEKRLLMRREAWCGGEYVNRDQEDEHL